MTWQLWKTVTGHPGIIGLAPTWSALLVLGRSRWLAFTAVTPFLGTLILFNHEVVDWLTLSPAVVGGWLGSEGLASVEASRSFTVMRLHLTYFGLLFLGLAAFSFSLACPPEVKRCSDVTDFINREMPLTTRARTRVLVEDVAADYLENHREGARGSETMRHAAYPEHLMRLHAAVFARITESIDWGEPSPGEKSTQEALAEAGFINGMGNVDIDTVTEAVWASRRVHRAFWEGFSDVAYESHLVDLLTLRFEAADRSKPVQRATIASAYALGFLLLLVPTLHTLILVIARLLGF